MAKKANAKKGAAKPAAKSRGDRALTKNQLYAHIAEATELSKAKVKEVFEELENLVITELKRPKPGQITIAGIKIRRAVKQPTPEREGRNPATGETTTIAAQPAKHVVRARALKAVQEEVKSMPVPKDAIKKKTEK